MRRLRRWLAVLLWSALVVSSFLDLDTPGDYSLFVRFGDAALAGDIPYPDPEAVRAGDTEGLYATWPPGFVPLAAGLARLDSVAHAPTVVAFQLFNLALLAVALWIFARWLTGRRPKWDAPIVVVALFVPLRMVLSNFEHAQVNLVVLGLVIAGLYLLDRRPIAGGLLFGLGSAIKATPILLLGYLAWRGRTRALGFALLGVAVCWVALPAPVLGPAATVDWWRAWAEALPAVGNRPGWMNASLNAVATRQFGTGPGHGAWLAGCVALAGIILLALGRPLRDVGPRRAAAEVAVLLAAITIVSPVSWKAHYVTLVPLSAAIWAASQRLEGRPRTAGLAVLGVAAAVLNLSSPELLGRDAMVALEERGLVVVAALALVVTALMLLRKAWPDGEARGGLA